jgi:hypothetical protein
MSSTGRNRRPTPQSELDPADQAELRRVMRQTADRLRTRGVALTGHESSDELVALFDAVERFELATESRGGDLMMDEPPEGSTPQPDDVHFALPRRGRQESVASYLGRLDAATQAIRHHRPIDASSPDATADEEPR